MQFGCQINCVEDTIAMADEVDLESQLRRLARHRAVFEAPGFAFGSWVPARRREDGVMMMGWYEPSAEAEAFLADARAMITSFDPSGGRADCRTRRRLRT